MNKVRASLVIGSIFLGGCQYLMPLTADEVPNLPRTNKGQGTFYEGPCHYDNREIGIPDFGSIVCN